jgi:hypothetical protein
MAHMDHVGEIPSADWLEPEQCHSAPVGRPNSPGPVKHDEARSGELFAS